MCQWTTCWNEDKFKSEIDKMAKNNDVPIIADGLEQLHGFHHAVNVLILQQLHIVTVHGYTENDGCHAFKTVYPLLPLWSLTTDVKESKGDAFVGEDRLHDPCGLHTGTEDVLLIRNVVRIG